MLLDTKDRVTLTGFSGCDIYLLKDMKEVGSVRAITWNKGRLIEGSIVITDLLSDSVPSDILIRAKKSRNICLEEYLIRNIEIDFVEGSILSDKLLSFKAEEIKKL